MDFFNTTEFDQALTEMNESEKKLVAILNNGMPEILEEGNKKKSMQELLRYYEIRYRERTLLFEQDLSDEAEKILEVFKGKPNARICEKLLRDPVFEKIIGNILNANLTADSFISVITKIGPEVKVNALKSSKKFSDIIKERAGRKLNFEQTKKWLLEQIKEDPTIAEPSRQEFIKTGWGNHVGDKEKLGEIIIKGTICDILEEMEANNLHPEFLVDLWRQWETEVEPESFYTPIVPNAGNGGAIFRLDTKFKEALEEKKKLNNFHGKTR